MSPNTSNLSHDRQVGAAKPHPVKHSREVTQQSHRIDHAPYRNRFSLGIFSTIAPARLVAASIPTESTKITCHGDSQAPNFGAGSHTNKGSVDLSLETLHNTTPETQAEAAAESLEPEGQGGGGRSLGSVPIITIHSIGQKI